MNLTEKKEEGLSDGEAREKLKEYGFNEIKDNIFSSPFKIFLRQIKNNAIIYLLLIAMIISFFVGKSVTAYTILAVILMVVTVGFVQEYRAEKVIASLKEMIMPVSIVIRDGKEKEVLSKEIVPGDLIILRSGEKIPADCLIFEDKDLIVNESTLTGESGGISKLALKSGKKMKPEENMLFMGTFIVNGRCLAKVVHTGMSTEFGKISGMIATAEKKLPLQDKLNQISKYMALIAVTFSVLTGILFFFNSEYSPGLIVEVLILVIALSVSAFPEGLPVVLITALSAGAYRMAKKNVIVNRMSIIETLGETTVICSDKTGTITKGEMTVKKIYLDNRIIDVSGTGYEAKGEFSEQDEKLNLSREKVLSLILKAGVLCNDAKIERTGEDEIYKTLGTPTESALLILAAKAGVYGQDIEYIRKEEIPFNSERKLMSVLCSLDKKNIVFAKGAPEYVLDKCKFIQREDGIFKLTNQYRDKITFFNKEMTKDSFRTIALAYKEVKDIKKNQLEENLVFLGIFAIEDPAREEVADSIRTCLNAGIKVKMITGDNKETAFAIAKQIGLKGDIMDGSELDSITDEKLCKIVNNIVVFARVKPQHKIRIVKALKANGETVAMTGDGVNDAPALKEAHVGIAMGKNGTDVSRSVADLTLKDDNFASIVEAIKEGRTIFKNIRKFVGYQLSCNYAELAILFVGVLLAPFLGWQVPLLLALQILFMNLITDDLPAITLGLNPQSKDVMDEKPRKKQQIINKPLLTWLLIAGTSMALMTLIAFYISFNIFGKSTAEARTIALLTLIFLEIAGAFNFRSFRKLVSLSTIKSNKYLIIASTLSIAATFVILYTPLSKAFETYPLDLSGWIIAFAFSLILISLFNFLKILNNRKNFLDLENA